MFVLTEQGVIAEVKAINKALTYVKVFTKKSFVILSDGMSI